MRASSAKQSEQSSQAVAIRAFTYRRCSCLISLMSSVTVTRCSSSPTVFSSAAILASSPFVSMALPLPPSFLSLSRHQQDLDYILEPFIEKLICPWALIERHAVGDQWGQIHAARLDKIEHLFASAQISHTHV